MATKEEQGRMLEHAIEAFHSDRYLMLRNIPEDIDTSSIKELFNELSVTVKELVINPSLQTAKVQLMDGNGYETMAKILVGKSKLYVKNTAITASLSANDHLLCVYNLPPNYTQQDFSKQVQLFGQINFCFLMFNEKLGEQCNYGFVKYTSREVASQAKNLLFRKNVGGHDLYCDWVEANLNTYDKLYSSCLFIDRLPTNYYNMMQFREIFSEVANPPYCQICLKNGQPTGFGIAEYNKSEECTKTYLALRDKLLINDTRPSLSFCVPGVRAINIVNKLLNSIQKQDGLLPEPPAAAAYLSKLQLMALQRPEVSSSLLGMVTKEVRNIMAQKGPAGDGHNVPSADLKFKIPLAMPIEQIHPPTRHLYPTPGMATVFGSNHSTNLVVNQVELLQQQMHLRQQMATATAYPQQALRRPLVERMSPNDNRFSPYARSTSRTVWDYSPISSKSTQTRDRNKTRERSTPHILPSPECSPDSLYVGQHSQGIGGHYADSHLRKKLSDQS